MSTEKVDMTDDGGLASLAARIRLAVAKLGSTRDAARAIGASASAVNYWTRGAAEPGCLAVCRLAAERMLEAVAAGAERRGELSDARRRALAEPAERERLIEGVEARMSGDARACALALLLSDEQLEEALSRRQAERRVPAPR